MSILIQNGTVVSASGTLDADVLVNGEKIRGVFPRADRPEGARIVAPEPVQVIDATGKYVLPGGIDVHTHMEMPFGGTFSACIITVAPALAACCMASRISPSVA